MRIRTESSSSGRSSQSDDLENKRGTKRARSGSNEATSGKVEYVGTNSKDPKMVASRIFVGNLPTSTGLKKEDVEIIFKKYGKIIGLLLMTGYAFVQFDNEESANRAKQENGTVVRGSTIEVRVASEKKKSNHQNSNSAPVDPFLHHSPGFVPPPYGTNLGQTPDFCPSNTFIRPPGVHSMVPTDCYRSPPLPISSKTLPLPLDCEIILVDESQRVYGETVMKRLLAAGLSADMKALPYELDTLSMVDLASRKGTLFAIIVNEQNEIHRSITVNILYGSPQEHRNMPLEDALTLITRKFDKYVITKKERLASSSALTHPARRAFNPPGPNVVYLLNLLVDGRFLTLAELDLVLDYVSERRDCLLKSEGLSARASGAPLGLNHATNRINSESHGSFRSEPISSDQPPNGPSTQPIGSEENSHKSLVSVFDNPLVQRALDSLFTTGPNILKSVSDAKPQYNSHQPSGCLFPSAPNISQRPLVHHSPFPNQRPAQQHLQNERNCRDTSAEMNWLTYAGN